MAPLASLFAFGLLSFGETFVVLFAILDPIGTVPLFMGLTERHPENRMRVVRESVVLASVILLVFASVGWLVFQILGITLNDFRIAGGVILFVVAFEHLSGREGGGEGSQPEEVAAFPLATPLLAGPGAISTVIILANPPYGLLLTYLVILLNGVVAYFILSGSALVQRVLGANGTKALSRITALLIAALAVSFVREGIVNVVTSLR